MNIFVLIMYLLVMAINWTLIHSKTEYNPNINRKYILIKNRRLAEILINKKSSYVKYVKVKDRQKLNIPCFVLYLAFALIVLVTVIFFLLPKMPCEPISMPFPRHNPIVLDTYNAKIPYVLAFLLFFVQINLYFVPMSIKVFKNKEQGLGIKIGVAILDLAFLLFSGYLLYALI